MKLYNSMFWLKIRSKLIRSFWKYADVPFEIAHTKIANKYDNPSDCKELLSSFNYNKKHWVIYIKNEQE